uniref:CCHC-type domain-containing protein n=1 Tax=Tanacetum cinerariifolium TaxID=118510 RepID=A0A6L2KJ23_TANCI|nr:hypothetical protein [Tanacetum cinerariifolium]
MHQPWRTLATIINKCLSRKTSNNDRLCPSRVAILWGMFYRKKVDYPELIWEDFAYQINYKQAKLRRLEIMPYPRFTKIIINNFLSLNPSIPKGPNSEYGRTIPDTILTEDIKQRVAYQTFIKYSTGLIPLKKSRGKGSLGKQQAVTSKKKVLIFVDDNIILKPDAALELGKSISLAKAEEEEAARPFDMMQALKASKKISKSRSHTRGLSEGAGVTPKVPDESAGVSKSSSEGTSTVGVLDEVKGASKAKANSAIDWEEENQDDDDDRSIDVEKTDDDKETNDEYICGDEYVHDDVDEEMKDVGDAKTRKDDEQITDAEKTDAEKTEVTKGDLEQARKLLLSSSSLSVSSGFCNQFLNLSSDASFIEGYAYPSICIIVWIRWVHLSSICVVIGADGYAYSGPKVLADLLPNHEEGERVNGLVDMEGVEDLGKVGCSYNEFLACNPKEYDGKGCDVVLTRWVEKIESMQDMSGCSIDQKVKYTAGSFMGNVNHVNARNPTVRACYECGNTDHVRSACPRLNRAQGLGGNHPNQVAANNEGQGRKNQGNQARGRAFMLGVKEAHHCLNIMTGTFTLSNHFATTFFDFGVDYSFVPTTFIPLLGIEPSELEIEGHVFDIDLISSRHGSFNMIIERNQKKKMRQVKSVKDKEKEQEKIVVVGNFPEVFLDDLSGLSPVREIKFRIELISRAVQITKAPYHLAPSELEELTVQLKELQDKGGACRSLKFSPGTAQEGETGEEQELAFQTLKDKLCNAPVLALPDGPEDFVVYCDASGTGLGLFSDYDYEIRYHLSKVYVVVDALSRKERKGLDKMIEQRNDGTLYYMDRIWVPLKGDAEHQRPSGLLQQPKIFIWKWEGIAMDLVTNEDYKMDRLATLYLNEIVDRHGVPISIISNCDSRFTSWFWQSMQDALGTRLNMRSSDVHLSLVKFSYNNSYHSSVRYASFKALYGRKCRSPIMWDDVREGQLIGLELRQETTKKISQITDRLKAARDRQKSYADKRRKPLNFSVDLPEELNSVYDMFHVSNLKKCLADPTLQVPLDKIRVDDKLKFMEKPMEILEREFKKLKRSRIAIVKVRWNSKRGPEFTWEHEDQMKLKYSHLFSDISS